jgi:hypothetical protein
MKTQVTLNGVTCKVGDIIERPTFHDREILFFGERGCYFKINNDCGNEAMGSISSLANWTVKKKTKKIKVECWLNIYPECVISFYSKEKADKSASNNRIACEHFVKKYEVEE